MDEELVIGVIVGSDDVDLLSIILVIFTICSLLLQQVMVYLWMPPREDADTLRLSMFTCRRVNTAVT